jgi:serpin B
VFAQATTGQGNNVVISPWSIQSALTMTWAGARGATANELAKTLNLPSDDGKVHQAFRAVQEGWAKARGQGEAGKENSTVEWRFANGMWVEKEYAIHKAYADLLAASYGASLEGTSFAGAPEKSRVAINDWAAQRTRGRVENLLAPGTIDTLTRIVLVNAVYFNGAWAHPFSEHRTAPAPFRDPAGERSVPTMHLQARLAYGSENSWEAVGLPYKDPAFDLVLVQPRGTSLEDLEKKLRKEGVGPIVAGMESTSVDLALPRFKVDGEARSLKAMLQGLGVRALFEQGSCDLSGLSPRNDLFVSEVVHKAFIDVHEKGTEAAAATAVVGQLRSKLRRPDKVVKFDQPFVFFLRHTPTKLVLFAGHVTKP